LANGKKVRRDVLGDLRPRVRGERNRRTWRRR